MSPEVQNIGLKTRDILSLIEETTVVAHERCSGHDGTYAVKKETRDKSVKIARPTVRKVNDQKSDHFISDCPMAENTLPTSQMGWTCPTPYDVAAHSVRP